MREKYTILNERLTKVVEQEFGTFYKAGYRLASDADNIPSPYKTSELFYEIVFRVVPKLGMYEDIGTVEECKKAMKFWKAAKELAGRGL